MAAPGAARAGVVDASYRLQGERVPDGVENAPRRGHAAASSLLLSEGFQVVWLTGTPCHTVALWLAGIARALCTCCTPPWACTSQGRCVSGCQWAVASNRQRCRVSLPNGGRGHPEPLIFDVDHGWGYHMFEVHAVEPPATPEAHLELARVAHLSMAGEMQQGRLAGACFG